MSRYRFIEAHRGHYPVRLLCQVMSAPASGYYTWHQMQAQPVAPSESAWETALVKVFGRHKRRYGARRLQVALRRKGYRVGRHRLRAAMRRRGLHALQPKAFTPRTTDSTHGLRCAPNRLLDQPKPVQANPIGVSDITYLPLANGDWAYLCTYQDMISKQVVGWHVMATMPEELVTKALQRFLGATAHAGPTRALRPRWAVLRQRLSAIAARPRDRARAEPPRSYPVGRLLR